MSVSSYVLYRGLKGFPTLIRKRAKGFLPTDVANLVLWMDPAAEFITLNGNDVSAWASRAGNSNFVQATENLQPAYAGVTLGGAQALDFSPDEEIRGGAGEPVFTIGTGGYYFAAAFDTNDVTDSQQVLFGNTASAFNFYSVGGSSTHPGQRTDGFISFSSLTMTNGVDYVVEYWRDGTDIRCRLNGVLDSDSKTSGASIPSVGGDKSMIGDDTPNGAHQLDGLVGDMVFYDELPSSNERNQIKNFLADKYSITVA